MDQMDSANMLIRYMAVRLTLDDSQFPSSKGSNVKTIFANSNQNSLTVEATITKASGLMPNSANITIYGMTNEDCNAFTRFNRVNGYQIFSNKVEVFAGYTVDSNGLPPLAYSGDVYIAGADFNDPSKPFNIVSMSKLGDQNTIVAETNPMGDMPLDNLFRSIVSKSSTPMIYVGTNVQGTGSNCNYTGSWIQQIQQACQDNGYQVKIDDNEVLITPNLNYYRSNKLLLSAKTGMLGYPIIAELGIDVRCIYNPLIKFGQQIQVFSEFQTQANKLWYINGLMHILQNRGPKWESILKLNETWFNLPE